MPRKPSTQPNDLELEILRVLWARGPSSVRDVHTALEEGRDTFYSSTAKMMEIMCDKGLLKRAPSRRPKLFEPALPAEQTQKQILRHLIHKVFGGSARNLVVRAVESEPLPADEVAEIRKLLKQIQKEKGP